MEDTQESTHGIHESMRVYGPDGAFLGWVSAVGPTHFVLSPGAAHPTVDYDIPMPAVRQVARGRVFLLHGLTDFDQIMDDAGTNLPPPSVGLEGEGGSAGWDRAPGPE